MDQHQFDPSEDLSTHAYCSPGRKSSATTQLPLATSGSQPCCSAGKTLLCLASSPHLLPDRERYIIQIQSVSIRYMSNSQPLLHCLSRQLSTELSQDSEPAHKFEPVYQAPNPSATRAFLQLCQTPSSPLHLSLRMHFKRCILPGNTTQTFPTPSGGNALMQWVLTRGVPTYDCHRSQQSAGPAAEHCLLVARTERSLL